MEDAKVHIGIAVHGNWEITQRALTKAITSALHAGMTPTVSLWDDNSPDNRVTSPENRVDFGGFVDKYIEHWHRSETNPNLGEALNWHISHIGDADYYLNLETDVFLEPPTIRVLAQNIGDSPAAGPLQVTWVPQGPKVADFRYYGAGFIPLDELAKYGVDKKRFVKWSNIGCLLIKGAVVRDPDIYSKSDIFKLWCVDTDFGARITRKYGPMVFCPDAKVEHVGQQSTKESTDGPYNHLLADAVKSVHAEHGVYLRGDVFL